MFGSSRVYPVGFSMDCGINLAACSNFAMFYKRISKGTGLVCASIAS